LIEVLFVDFEEDSELAAFSVEIWNTIFEEELSLPL